MDHVSISVADLDRSLAFYRDLLGLPVLGTGEESGGDIETITGIAKARFRYADLDLGSGQILEILRYLEPRGSPIAPRVYDPGGGHLGVRVDDVVAVLRRLAASGPPSRSEPRELAEPAWWAGARCAYIHDLDGITVELVERWGGASSGFPSSR